MGGLGAVLAVFRTFAAAPVDDGAEIEDVSAEDVYKRQGLNRPGKRCVPAAVSGWPWPAYWQSPSV